VPFGPKSYAVPTLPAGAPIVGWIVIVVLWPSAFAGTTTDALLSELVAVPPALPIVLGQVLEKGGLAVTITVAARNLEGLVEMLGGCLEAPRLQRRRAEHVQAAHRAAGITVLAERHERRDSVALAVRVPAHAVFEVGERGLQMARLGRAVAKLRVCGFEPPQALLGAAADLKETREGRRGIEHLRATVLDAKTPGRQQIA
jgi:hypothetical protein